jgi:conjugative relaxase-like TrwC/TraI family protein
MARLTRIKRDALDYYARDELEEPAIGGVWGQTYGSPFGSVSQSAEGVGILMDELSVAAGVRRKIAVLDLTFAAPKAVSVRWALADQVDSERIEAAHRKSVARSLWYLRTTDLVKLDRLDHPHGVQALSYAAFSHRLSRDGDPHLHDHVVLVNAAQFENLGMRALDLTRLTRVLPMLEVIYRAELERSLRSTLGIQLVGRQLGSLQIVGQPDALSAVFSSRRATVMEHSSRFGSSARSRALAALVTRPDKEVRTLSERRKAWRTLADPIVPSRGDRTRGVAYYRGEDLQAAGGVYLSPSPGHLHSEVGYQLLCDHERPVAEIVDGAAKSFGLDLGSDGESQGLLAIRIDRDRRAREGVTLAPPSTHTRLLGRSEREGRFLATRGLGVPYEGVRSGRVRLDVPAPERLAESQVNDLISARRLEGVARIAQETPQSRDPSEQDSRLVIKLDASREVSVFFARDAQRAYLVTRVRSYLHRDDASAALDVVVGGASRAGMRELHQAVFVDADRVSCRGLGSFAIGEPVRLRFEGGEASGLVVGGGAEELRIRDREGVESMWRPSSLSSIERTLMRTDGDRGPREWGIIEVSTPEFTEFTTTASYLERSNPLLRYDRIEELAHADFERLIPRGVVWARLARTRSGIDRVVEHVRSFDTQEMDLPVVSVGGPDQLARARSKMRARSGFELER